MEGFRQYRAIEKGEFILMAVDTASGGPDYTAMQALSKSKIDVPLVFQSRSTTSEFIPGFAQTAEKIYDETGVKPFVCLERNNGGSFLMDRIAAINYKAKYEIFKMPNYGRENAPEAVRYGFDMNSATRPKALQDLKDAIDKKAITIYDKPTITEMFSFVVMQTSSTWKAQAERNAHDDLVMSLAIAWQMYQYCELPTDPQSINRVINELPKEELFDSDGFYT